MDLKDLNARLAPQHSFLVGSFASGAIEKPEYFRGLVTLAYEYAKDGYTEEAHNILAAVEPSYFDGPAQLQMDTDSKYHAIASHLVELIGFSVLPTQGLANA